LCWLDWIYSLNFFAYVLDVDVDWIN
jgi:hypothetical protein